MPRRSSTIAGASSATACGTKTSFRSSGSRALAQFQAYRNSRGSREEVPFLLDVQSNLIQTGSRLVVPLVLATRYGLLYTRLNPGFTVDGIKVIAAVSDLAAIDERELRMVVADLSAHRDTLMQAIDFLITGY
ncbi:hypothetical protein D0B54_00250 [Solimonas sp. K1W22B-7]|nr:hypothetical protein D0B54_00250 [Solimonas sp. K1W22B-7]